MNRIWSRVALTASIVGLQAAMLPALNHYTIRAEKKKIILQHADTIEGGEAGGTTYRSAAGNVLFLHDKVTLRCDRATDYPSQQKIVLQGNVFIADDTIEIRADKGVYYPERETGELTGNVRGRVADNSIVARARSAVINKADNRIWLNGDAIAWQERRQVSGEVISLHIREASGEAKKRRIDEVQVEGNAFFAARDTISVAPAAYDQLRGKTLELRMDDNSRITGITATREAEILYHLYDENRKPSGINYSSGNMIRMFFREGTLKRVKVTGNVEGKQYPEQFRGERSINLSGFAWRESENPFRDKKSLPQTEGLE
ncbi:MAG: LptA/OstA family protein [Chlorobiaceae bacterium]